jgi:hypothetical protein
VKNTLLFYLLLLLLCGCTNNPHNNQAQGRGSSQILKETFVRSPKAIHPSGTFVSKDNPFYQSVTFKGKKTVVIRDAIFGIDFPSEYEKDEEFLQVKTDKSDLLFEIISEDTIKGEGFAEGLYIKIH